MDRRSPTADEDHIPAWLTWSAVGAGGVAGLAVATLPEAGPSLQAWTFFAVMLAAAPLVVLTRFRSAALAACPAALGYFCAMAGRTFLFGAAGDGRGEDYSWADWWLGGLFAAFAMVSLAATTLAVNPRSRAAARTSVALASPFLLGFTGLMAPFGAIGRNLVAAVLAVVGILLGLAATSVVVTGAIAARKARLAPSRRFDPP